MTTTLTTVAPVLATLVFSTGGRALLDRTTVVGRNPHRIDGHPDASPAMIRLAHPAVSRQHALIEVDDWAAHLVDLGSANGTRLTVAGRSHSLHHHQRVALSIGSVIEFGGAVTCTIEEVGE